MSDVNSPSRAIKQELDVACTAKLLYGEANAQIVWKDWAGLDTFH